jgi:hypothetical protein
MSDAVDPLGDESCDGSWYDWRVEHWGTRWDTGRSVGSLKVLSKDTIKLDFKTFLVPPKPVLDRWVDLGLKVSGRFDQPEWDIRYRHENKDVCRL